MRHWVVIPLGLLIALTGCASGDIGSGDDASGEEAPWTILFDGSTLDGWQAIGDANWELADGAVQADSGSGFLISDDSYDNFELRVEFWVDEPANSGVFIRCSSRETVDAENAYEVNIFDTRPEQNYRTGSVVNVAEPLATIDAGGQWNTFEIHANGSHLRVLLNGTLMVDVEHEGHVDGPIALQYGSGVVRFRNVQVQEL